MLGIKEQLWWEYVLALTYWGSVRGSTIVMVTGLNANADAQSIAEVLVDFQLKTPQRHKNVLITKPAE